MAYCAYCGKELPEGSVCTCPDAQNIMAAVQQALKAQAAAAPQPAPKKKSRVWIPVLVTLLVTTLAAGVGGYFIYPALNRDSGKSSSSKSSKSSAYYDDDNDDSPLSAVSPGTPSKNNVNSNQDETGSDSVSAVNEADFTPSDDYEEQLQSFYEVSYSVNGAEEYYSYIYPDELIDGLRSNGRFDELVRSRNESTDSFVNSGAKIEIIEITDSSPLTDDQLDVAAKHFEEIGDNLGVRVSGISISDGAELEAVFLYTYPNGTTTTQHSALCVVYIDGDGWKVIPTSAKNL